MLRRLQVHVHKAADATFKSATPTVRGRLAQKDFATGTAIVPTSQDQLFFVNKDDYPIGLMAYEGEISSYDARLDGVKAGEHVVLEKPLPGEIYGTTEFIEAGLAEGDYLEVETAGNDAGKLKKAAAATSFLYRGTKNDNGHKLARVEIV